jgi:hypothetical protein
MLHMFCLDVSKVDQVLRDAVAGGERPAAGIVVNSIPVPAGMAGMSHTGP